MKKLVGLTLIVLLGITVCASTASAQKVIRKTVRKIVRPSIAPTPAPTKVPTTETVPTPPEPPTTKTTETKKGLFGWGLNTDLSGLYLMTRNQTGLMGAVGARGDIVFDDPLKLGSRIGLAEDALEYKVGLGLAFGADVNNAPINTIPLFADAVLYFKEGSLFGMDPYMGLGANLNLYGTGQTSGGLGSQIYGGLLADFGFEAGKTGFQIGYNAHRVGNTLLAEGISFSVMQPFIL